MHSSSITSYQRFSLLILCTLTTTISHAAGQTVLITRSAPDIDRWVYPFNGAPGYRSVASVFGSLGQETAFPPLSFDQRDAQFLVGFDLAPELVAGRGSCRYRVLSAQIILTTSTDLSFRYDPTYDLWTSYQGGAADADGRPIELYGAAFRNGWSACQIDPGVPALNQFPCYYEGTPTQPGPPFGPGTFPTAGSRHCFATDFANRVERDVSNNVRDGFDPAPFAVGQIAGLGVGAFVPVDRDVVFTLDVAQPDVQAYLRRACDTGLLRLVVTSLQQASSAPGGGIGDGQFASFYCKEIEVEGLAARLTMDVRLIPQGDADADGSVSFSDITTILSSWGLAGPQGDANCDGEINFADITETLSNWGGAG